MLPATQGSLFDQSHRPGTAPLDGTVERIVLSPDNDFLRVMQGTGPVMGR